MKAFYLPENLNLKSIIEERNHNLLRHIDDIKYIISTIITLRLHYKDNLDRDFISINAQVLQARVRRYNDYIDFLLKNNIIESDYFYIVGEKSRGYKLAKLYSDSTIITEPIAKRPLARMRPEERVDERRLNRQYGYLTKWFNSDLKIDTPNAVEALKELQSQEQKENIKKNHQERFNIRMLSLNNINNAIWHLNVDDTVKRFHSNLTNLKSELRNYLTYGSESLCSIDIKNSQPFISTILLNPKFYEEAKNEQELTLYNISKLHHKTIKPNISNILSILNKDSSIIMLVKRDVSLCRSDIDLYCTLVDKGLLYEYLSDKHAERTGEKLDIRIREQKAKLKEAVFVTMFSRNNYRGPGYEMKKLFADLFPTVYRIFYLIKDRQSSLLPIILQLVESEIVLRRAAKVIGETHPTLPIYTIHDSIATIAGAEEIVWQELKQQFSSAIGLMPSLHKELWSLNRTESSDKS